MFKVRPDLFKETIIMFHLSVKTLKSQMTECAIGVFNYLERNVLMIIYSNCVTFITFTRGFWLLVIIFKMLEWLITMKTCLRQTNYA